MSKRFAPDPMTHCQTISRIAGAMSIATGFVVLAGWASGISLLKRIVPGQLAMKANTALCFVLVGAALWLLQEDLTKDSRALLRRRIGQACAGLVLLLAFAVLSQYLFGWNLGIDQLLFQDSPADPGLPPGRMAIATALTFVLLGSGLLALDLELRLGGWPAQWPVLASGLVGVFGLLDFLGNPDFHTYMAVSTAVLFVLVALGILCTRPRRGLMVLVLSAGPGGMMVRWLVPIALALPLLLDWLRSEATLGDRSVPARLLQAVDLFLDSTVVTGAIVVFAWMLDRAHVQRLEAEQAMRLQAAALEAAENDICITDREGSIQWVNPAFIRETGYEAAELLGQNPRLLKSGKQDREFYKHLWATIQSGQVWEGVMTNRRKNGTVYDAHRVIAPVRSGDGRVSHFVAIGTDITERLRAEEALRESEERYCRLVQISPDAILVCCAEEVVFINPAGVKLFGARTASDLLGKALADLVHLDFEECGRKQIREHTDTDSPAQTMVQSLLRLDGSTVEVEVAVVPLVWQNRPALQIILRDITEREQAERALRESEATLRSLVDNAPYAIYRTHVRGGFMSVNPALVRMLGYSTAEEVLALDLERDLYLDENEQERIMAEIRRAGSFQGLELHWKCKGGAKLLVRASGQLLRGEGGEFIESIAEDITARHLLEQQFRHAQKMEAIGQLAGGVAHDFNNLLMAISSFTEMALVPEVTLNNRERYLEEVLKAARRAAGLTQQLLAFSRKQVLATTVLDLNEVVSDVSKMLRRLIGEHIEMRIVKASRNTTVKADRGQVEQVLMNLAVNARDAMTGGGTLVVEVQDAFFDKPHLGPGYAIPPGAYAMLAVSDTGTGMSREVLEHVFEPFFTTKERGKGTGLGLATVYGIVKQSGGYLSVYSELGVGTNFKIYFPMVDMPASRPGKLPAQSALGGTETICLTEDDEAVRLATWEFLVTKGYNVFVAANPVEALQKCLEHTGHIDLLVTDIVMPGMSGVELAQKLHQHIPDLRVIYVSGYTDGAIASVAELPREADFLQKPFSLESLAQKVRASLDAVGKSRPPLDAQGEQA